MSTADLAFGKRVVYQGQPAEIVDICWRPGIDRTTVQIRIPGTGRRWVRPSELEAAHADA